MNADNLQITENALQRVGQLIAQKENPGLKLRVYIKGGGCSGFQYGFQLDEQANDDDVTIDCGEVELVIDPLSLQYLTGAEIDYKDDLQGSRFVVNNPNASTTCGCGSSFSI